MKAALVLAAAALAVAVGALAYSIASNRETAVPAARECLRRAGATVLTSPEPPPFLRDDARLRTLVAGERRALEQELTALLLQSSRGTVLAIGEDARMGADERVVLRIATEPLSLALLAVGPEPVVRRCLQAGVAAA